MGLGSVGIPDDDDVDVMTRIFLVFDVAARLNVVQGFAFASPLGSGTIASSTESQARPSSSIKGANGRNDSGACSDRPHTIYLTRPTAPKLRFPQKDGAEPFLSMRMRTLRN